LVTVKEVWHLLSPYIRKRLLAQIRAVSFIVVYLILFQTIVLRLPGDQSLVISGGIGLVVVGLALFMEGLFLGLMPLGESIGLKIPGRVPLFGVLLFSLLLGLGATFAEPAIGVLRAAGYSVVKENSPLLHYLLNERSEYLVLAVAIGVGVAVLIGMLRFLYNWSLKPLIFIFVPMLLVLTVAAYFDPAMAHVIGLAWDSGAVTTGPVTVPLVLALGLGVSRVVAGHTSEGSTSGFGVVTLASLFPIIAVLLLGFYYSLTLPELRELSSVAQVSSVDSADFEGGVRSKQLEEVSLARDFSSFIWESFVTALRAVLPLTIFMIFVFRFLIGEKFAQFDEIVVGIVLAVAGMMTFIIGIEYGLGKLGNQVGQHLPASYTSIELRHRQSKISGFDTELIQTAIDDRGQKRSFFFLKSEDTYEAVAFDPKNYDELRKEYLYTPSYGPVFGRAEAQFVGLIVVVLFAFFMGYGATIAEPALNALGATVEDVTVGVFRKAMLIQAVAVGVGLGIALGISRIIWDIPLIFLLIPAYMGLLVLTYLSSEYFVNIAWDSAGVTTGPITVPLVLAMGLGIGSQTGAVEGFGILAMASVMPIMSVLIVGLNVSRRRKSMLTATEAS